MEKDKIIEQMLKEKSGYPNNSIDLDAYAIGLVDMYEKLAFPQANVSGILHPDIEKLLRYTVKQWSSINEQREPDHEDLVQNWLDGDCKEWIKHSF